MCIVSTTIELVDATTTEERRRRSSSSVSTNAGSSNNNHNSIIENSCVKANLPLCARKGKCGKYSTTIYDSTPEVKSL